MGNGRDVPARCREVIPGASPCPYEYTPGNLVPANIGHNLLLGGNGNNVIHAGPAGDVIWGDYKPSGDPTSQVNHLYGGPGTDWPMPPTAPTTSGPGRARTTSYWSTATGSCTQRTRAQDDRPAHSWPQNRHYQLIGCSNATIIPYAV